jgi:hypothetical protein
MDHGMGNTDDALDRVRGHRKQLERDRQRP